LRSQRLLLSQKHLLLLLLLLLLLVLLLLLRYRQHVFLIQYTVDELANVVSVPVADRTPFAMTSCQLSTLANNGLVNRLPLFCDG
jgi:hypothetical protein